MAYTWRTNKTGSAAGTSIVVTEPTSAASGDWEFVLIATSSNAITVGTPAGWTLFGTSAGVNTRFYIFYVTGGRGGSAPGLTFTASGGSGHEWHCLGVAGSNVTIDASATAVLATATNPDPPSATATVASTESIAIGFNFAGATWTAPSTYSMRSVNTGGLDCAVASKDLVGTGAENPGTFTGPGGANDVWAATILLQPTGGGGGATPSLDASMMLTGVQ